MNNKPFVVTVLDIIKKFSLEVLSETKDMEKIEISNTDTIRPSLQLTGYFDNFDETRIQVCGMVEMTYLKSMTPQERLESLDKLFSKKIPVNNAKYIKLCYNTRGK